MARARRRAADGGAGRSRGRRAARAAQRACGRCRHRGVVAHRRAGSFRAGSPGERVGVPASRTRRTATGRRKRGAGAQRARTGLGRARAARRPGRAEEGRPARPVPEPAGANRSERSARPRPCRALRRRRGPVPQRRRCARGRCSGAARPAGGGAAVHALFCTPRRSQRHGPCSTGGSPHQTRRRCGESSRRGTA